MPSRICSELGTGITGTGLGPPPTLVTQVRLVCASPWCPPSTSSAAELQRGVQLLFALLLRPAPRAHLSISRASSDHLPDAKATALRAKSKATDTSLKFQNPDICVQEGPWGLRTPELGGPVRKVCNTSRFRARLACALTRPAPRSESTVD